MAYSFGIVHNERVLVAEKRQERRLRKKEKKWRKRRDGKKREAEGDVRISNYQQNRKKDTYFVPFLILISNNFKRKVNHSNYER